MKKIIFFCLLVGFLLAADYELIDNVAQMNDDNYDKILANNENVLVKFYAPWCGHCKKLAPDYAAASKQLIESKANVVLAEIDANENKEAATKNNIEGFPTIKFFTDYGKKTIEYNGGRTEADILKWVLKRVGDASVELKTLDDFDKFLRDNKVGVILFTEDISSEKFAIFKKLAQSDENVAYAHVMNKDIAATQKVTLDNNLVLFKQFDEGRNDFNKEFNEENVKQFLNENSFPTIMEFDDRAIERVFQQQVPTIFLFSNNNEESTAALEAFRSAAVEFKGENIQFSLSTPTDGHGHYQRLADFVGVNVALAPQIMLVHSTQEELEKYQFSQTISKENLVIFVSKYLKDPNNVEKYMKSDEIPESNDEPVKVIVGKTWADMVLNNDKDVLVKFYAPWCGHCKALAPKYDELAKKLANNKNILIAKVDSTSNEIPGVNIRGFPTLKYFPGNDKKNPKEYGGAREVEDMMNYLKENTTHQWVEAKEDL